MTELVGRELFFLTQRCAYGLLSWEDLVALKKAINYFGVFLFFLLEHLLQQEQEQDKVITSSETSES